MLSKKKFFLVICLCAVIGLCLYWWYGYYRATYPEELLETKDQIFSLNDFVSSGATTGAIPAIDEPVFESVLSADQYLDDQGRGIVVRRNGLTRFYPYQILVWHEVVNDIFSGKNLVITYCPLCSSGIVFDRTIGEQELSFETAGVVWNNNLVLQDRETNSLWVQLLHQSVDGSFLGTVLEVYPSSEMTWNDFKQNYPSGNVLSRNTGVERDYTRDPYGDYQENHAVLFSLTHLDERLSSKELVYGVETASGTKVYPLSLFSNKIEIPDVVGSTAITISASEGQITLSSQEDAIGIKTRWFCWATAHPHTDIYNP